MNPSQHKIILVTGAARSGKSEWAEKLASQSKLAIIYIATAQVDPQDVEWQARIVQHQQRRPTHWQTLSLPKAISPTIKQAPATQCLLIDSVGTWTANLLDLNFSQWEQQCQELLRSLEHSSAMIIMVAEETGWGIVPAYKSGRLFRDRLGHLSRQIGAIADTVYLVTAGHALNLSQLGTPISKENY